MQMKKKMVLMIGIPVVVVIVSVLIIWRSTRYQETVQPKRGEVVESIYGLGTVTADKSFNIRAGVAISVNKLFVKEGDIVKRGAHLVKIDDSIFHSPIDGTITKVSFKEGELAAAQASILTVTNLKNLYLEVSLEQQSVLRIKEGQKTYISFETLRDERYSGYVKTVYPRENQFIVRIELEKWPEGVLPGMTADTAILVGKKNNVILIPISIISSGQVTRLRGSKKEKISIKLGVISGEWAEVISDNIIESDILVK